MATQAKNEANGRNGKKSTGPRTAAGKAASSGNAVRHGLLAKVATLPEADQNEFLALHAAFEGSLAPVGAWEVFLVERIAVCALQLRREFLIESTSFSHYGEVVRPNGCGTETPDSQEASVASQSVLALAGAFARDAGGLGIFERLSRYRVKAQREMHQSLVALAQSQARRAEEATAGEGESAEGLEEGPDSTTPNGESQHDAVGDAALSTLRNEPSDDVVPRAEGHEDGSPQRPTVAVGEDTSVAAWTAESEVKPVVT